MTNVLKLCREIDGVPHLTNAEYEKLERESVSETNTLTQSEAEFYRAVRKKGKYKIGRSGWPDFILHNEKTGKIFCVEVKSGDDSLRPSQRRMIELLEVAGIATYMWRPTMGRTLVPWREFKKKALTGNVS